jgi:prepilin-type N-terminal cleavage/methylation domain-containing protein
MGQVTGDKIATATRQAQSYHASCVTRHLLAFTLIELLTVIAIIGVLAALILPVAGAVRRQATIRTAQAEMAQLETAIDRYKSAYGFYPPDNPCNPLVNQLYFELLGTTNIGNTTPNYQSLDDPTIQVTQSSLTSSSGVFGLDGNGNSCVSGFMNCNKPSSGEDARMAQNFLPGLKLHQVVVYTNRFPDNPIPIKIIITSVGGPDRAYKPLSALDLNPWRYNSSSPTNNPGAYDLWVQLVIAGKTNLICNWNKQVQINSPLP